MHARMMLAAIAIAALWIAPAFAQAPHAAHAVQDVHAGHTMPAAQTPAPGVRDPNLPPDNDAAKDQLAKSPRHGEWVDIKLPGGPAINSFVMYPERSTKAPVVIVVHDIGGMSDWARAIGDQLAKEGLHQRKNRAFGSFIQAIRDYAVALFVPHRLEAEAKPLRNALRAGRFAVAQLEFNGLRRGHDDQWDMKPALAL